MQTALLSALKHTPEGKLRAALTVGGRTVLAWQAELALRLGCKRIFCLCDDASDEILDLQSVVEAEGGEFHLVRSSIQLVALLRSDDSLLLLADGLMVDADRAAELMCEDGKLAKAIVTIPADSALADRYPEDFERIDAGRSWAGVLAMRAAPAQRLADLPPDGDAVSLLLRLALQGQTKTTALPLEGEGGEEWLLAVDDAVAERHERALVARASPALSASGPGQGLAVWAVRLMAPFGMTHGALAGAGIAASFALAGAGGAYLGYPVVGLIFAAFSAFAAAFSDAWRTLSGALLGKSFNRKFGIYLNGLIDTLAIITLFFAMPEQTITSGAAALFAIGLARLAAINAPSAIAPFWNDRTVHLAIFAVCAVYGLLSEALAVFGVIALAQVVIHQARMPTDGRT